MKSGKILKANSASIFNFSNNCQGRDWLGIRSGRIPLNFSENGREIHYTRYLDLQFHYYQ
ncbi:MAG: hypothetical protein ACFFCV_20295 [Promethearchaeota archaeon]